MSGAAGSKGARTGGRWAWILALAALVLCWTVQFRPVLFQHQNLLGYRLLDSRYTGLPAEKERRSAFNRLPSQDASLLLTHYPYQAFLSRQFKGGVIPLWNPDVACGTPVTSDPQYKPLNPFFWPFFASPTPWMFSLGIALMALAGLIGWGFFLRHCDLTWPAVVIGSFLMVCGPLTQQTIVLSSSWVAWMAPWGLLAAEGWHRRRPAALAAFSAIVALTLYIGHPLIALLYAAIASAYLVSRPSERTGRERLGALAISAAAVCSRISGMRSSTCL